VPTEYGHYCDTMARLHAQMKLAFDPWRADGCEVLAHRSGCWTCATKEEQAKWRRMIRKVNPSNHVRIDHCALFLDFTKRHAVIRNSGFCSWEEHLPDGWTHEIVGDRCSVATPQATPAMTRA